MRYAVRVATLIFLVILAWRSVNWMSDYEPGTDSSIFISIGWHLDNGRTLYKDVWDHKPPVIFALNSVALGVGDDGANSVRTMEQVFAVLGVAAFFVAVYLAFGRFWLAALTSILYLQQFYQPYVIELGNVTEEYGAVFFVAGMAAAIASLKQSGRRSLVLGAIAGAAFSLAVLSKEPFLLIVPPWFLLVAWPRGGDWKNARDHSAAFVLGAIVPFLIFFGYLISHGAFSDWRDAVAFNFLNKAGAGVRAPDPEPFPLRVLHMANEKMHPLMLALVGTMLGLVSLFRSSYVRRRHGLPFVIAASGVLSLLATSLGGGFSGHYYLFFVPSFVLLCALGIDFAADLVSHNRRLSIAALACLLIPLAFDAADLKSYGRYLAMPNRRWQGLSLSRVIGETTSPGDLIWAPWKPLIYVEAHRLSPTKWLFAFDHLFIDTPRSTASEKLKTLRDDLEHHPPRVIVLNTPAGLGRTRVQTDQFLARAGLTSWIAANYVSALGSHDTEFELLTRKAAVNGVASPPY